MKSKNEQYLLHAKILVLIISLLTIVNIWSEKTYFHDGARFLNELLKGHWHAYDSNLRLSSIPWQILTSFLSRVFPVEHKSDAIKFFYKFFMTIHPLVSITFCYFILKKQERLKLILFPIFSYLGVSLLTFTNQGTPIVEAPSYFWPLIFLISDLGKKRFFLFITVIILYYQLVVTYISSILLALIINICILKYFRKNYKIQTLNFFLLISSIVFNLYKYMTLADPVTKIRIIEESLSLIKNIDFLKLGIPLYLFILYMLYSQLYKKNKFFYDLVFLLLVSGASIFSLYGLFVSSDPSNYINMAWPARHLIIPLNCVFGFLYMKNGHCLVEKYWRGVSFIIFVVLVFHNSIFDLYSSINFKRGVNNFREILSTSKGCSNISSSEFKKLLGKYGIIRYNMRFLSLILSGRNLNSLLVVEVEENKIDGENVVLDTCNSFTEFGYPYALGGGISFFDLNSQSYPYHQINKNLFSKSRNLKVIRGENFEMNGGYIVFTPKMRSVKFSIDKSYDKLKFKMINNQKYYKFNIFKNGLRASSLIVEQMDNTYDVLNISAGDYEMILSSESEINMHNPPYVSAITILD